jgi:hypothetical protein
MAGARCRTPLSCYFNLQQVGAETFVLTTDIEARPAPLLMMASGGDHDKRPWSGGPNHDGHQSLSLAGPHRRPGGVLLHVGSSLGLFLVVALIPAC